MSNPASATEECVNGGAYFTVEADVFDPDGDDVAVQWHITYADGETATFSDTVSFGNPLSPVTIQLADGPLFFPIGESSVSVCVSDGIAETECGSPITLTVADTADPIVLTYQDRIEVGNDLGACFATVDVNSAPYAPEFSDVCCPDVSGTNDAPPIFMIGETLVTWTVSDCAGNSIQVTQTVVVADIEPPTATAPQNVVVGHDPGTCEATGVNLGVPTADDNCSVASITNDAMEPFQTGETEVMWFISDDAGNMTIVTQTVTVTNEDPVAIAGEDVYVECDSDAGTAVTLDGSLSSDPDAGDILSYTWEAVDITFDDPHSANPTANFPHGTTTVSLLVEDQCGGMSSTDVLVVVQDTTSPVIQAAVLNQQVLWPPNHNMVPIALDMLVSDLCTAPEELILECTVTSNEADDELGDGSFTGDVDGADGYAQSVPVTLAYNASTERWEGTLFLRAERNGDGEGRKYSIRCLAGDTSGNVSEATVCVTVPHSQGRGRGR